MHSHHGHNATHPRIGTHSHRQPEVLLMQLNDTVIPLHTKRPAFSLMEVDAVENAMPRAMLYGDQVFDTWKRQLSYHSLVVRSHGASQVSLAQLDGVTTADVAGKSSQFARACREMASSWHQAFVQSFWEVASAEIFDKTWFVSLLCAIAYGARAALRGAVAALGSHVIIAIAFGLGISHIVPVCTLHFIIAGIFGLLTVFYVNEWFDISDPRVDGLEADERGTVRKATPAEESEDEKDEVQMQSDSVWYPHLDHAEFVCCFLPVFLAEWGDRTQVSMIALSSVLPVVPVCLGGALALLLLTGFVVLPTTIVSRRKPSERVTNAVTALGLCLFTALSLWHGIQARDAMRA